MNMQDRKRVGFYPYIGDVTVFMRRNEGDKGSFSCVRMFVPAENSAEYMFRIVGTDDHIQGDDMGEILIPLDPDTREVVVQEQTRLDVTHTYIRHETHRFTVPPGYICVMSVMDAPGGHIPMSISTTPVPSPSHSRTSQYSPRYGHKSVVDKVNDAFRVQYEQC